MSNNLHSTTYGSISVKLLRVKKTYICNFRIKQLYVEKISENYYGLWGDGPHWI